MAKKKHPTPFLSFLATPRMLRVIAFGALCLLGSFTIGVNTAGPVKTTDPSYAYEVEASLIAGRDVRSLEDVIYMLNVLNGTARMDAEQMSAADANGDGSFTLQDVIIHAENLL